MSPRKESASAGPRQVLSPGAERRRLMREQRRQDLLRHSWQVVVLSAAAAGLGWLLLRQGWILRGPEQVDVSGSQQVSREQVIQAARLTFPVPLLELRPQAITAALGAALPVENVRVSRLMLPPRLRVQLVDRQAVARAQRRTAQGMEQGYVDRYGNWMSRRQQQGAGGSGPAAGTSVVGWQQRYRPALGQVLARRDDLGSPLLEVRFEPSGSLWLRTASLGLLRLGPPDAQLERRLEVISHLSQELPAKVRNLKLQAIDLSNPDQPELGLAAPLQGNGDRKGSAAAGVD
ncbi:FtsQ-type POTRA domain-containing protein [Cyanobium sp. Morenito 9A2]|uniref:cell division protein FtsQ/DivIB n=1 Tax=Cyanobium sp. Morenito 9A2 TaxID=2823718 RepID=UPI0020CE912D|nr:FtsQ-type POTRA domain-containing protein [Cyanobium sp. Morenito 9A2]